MLAAPKEDFLGRVAMAERKRAVTPLQHTALGALGGSVEVLVMQPLVGIKNALQEGRPIPRNPRHLYRGLGMNVMSMAPITATQFGTARLVQQLVLGREGGELTGSQRLGCAAVAGAASAFIASPSELIIIHQQKSGRSLAAETSSFNSTYGVRSIGRGLLPTIGREALYAGGYLGLCPVVKDYLDKNHAAELPAGATTAISGVLGGFFGAFFSHPFDTVKTRMQAAMYSKAEYRTLSSTVSTIYKEGGVTQFWRGLLPRLTRIVGATFILNHIRVKGVEFLE